MIYFADKDFVEVGGKSGPGPAFAVVHPFVQAVHTFLQQTCKNAKCRCQTTFGMFKGQEAWQYRISMAIIGSHEAGLRVSNPPLYEETLLWLYVEEKSKRCHVFYRVNSEKRPEEFENLEELTTALHKFLRNHETRTRMKELAKNGLSVN